VLHLASHGFFLTPQPGRATADRDLLSRLADQVENPLLRSGLAMAGINSWNKGLPLPAAAENGILTGEDVSGLDLTATELVVLSACETGLGAVEVGEGVFGLRRAFMLAGAKSLVMSLWEVPDKQTQQLMADFYANLAQGESPAIALRQAQLKLAEAQPNPFYWGAFICQGEVA
jgi:CHAT domain-containing protein